MWLYQPLLPGGAQLQSGASTGAATQNITPTVTATGALAITGTASQNVTPVVAATGSLSAGAASGAAVQAGRVSIGLSIGL